MLSCALKLITAPATEPVTAEYVKLAARIDGSTEDDLIESWIRAGRELAENYQRRAYVSQTWEVTYDGFPQLPIMLPRPPLASVTTVKYYDYQGTESVYYNSAVPVSTNGELIIDTDSEPGRIDHAYGCSWPTVTLRPSNAVKIRYTAGYTVVPDTVKDAIVLYCNYRYENRVAETPLPQQFYDLLTPNRVYM